MPVRIRQPLLFFGHFVIPKLGSEKTMFRGGDMTDTDCSFCHGKKKVLDPVLFREVDCYCVKDSGESHDE